MDKNSHQLKRRLRALGADLYPAIRHHAISMSGRKEGIWTYMLNGNPPSTEILVELCDILNCSPRQLLDSKHELSRDSALAYLKEQELPEKFRTLIAA